MGEYQITYRNRFPVQPKRDDGTWGCRGCGGALPKGRFAWCSDQCCKRFHPAWVKSAVNDRDKQVCCECGFDRTKAYREWSAERSRNKKLDYFEWSARQPKPVEHDHIIPFSEGGLTVVENMRTLCRECHKKRTRRWHKDRKRNPEEIEFAL